MVIPGDAPIWEVIGGSKKGGVIVRYGYELASDKANDRLLTGSHVEEVELRGDRLHFRLLHGHGPQSGWVSIRLSDGCALLKPIPKVSLHPNLHAHQSPFQTCAIQPPKAHLIGQHDDAYDWGAVLCNNGADIASFLVTPSRGAILGKISGDNVDEITGQCLLAQGAKLHLILRKYRQKIDESLVRRVLVEVDCTSAELLDQARPVRGWIRWTDVELVPYVVDSAAHHEAVVDKVFERKRNSQLVGEDRGAHDTEFAKAFWHRQGCFNSTTFKDSNLGAYVSRVFSVRQLREHTFENIGRPCTRCSLAVPDPAALNSHSFAQGPEPFHDVDSCVEVDWSGSCTVRAVIPSAVHDRVSVVCPTYHKRHHLHESLYLCFCNQSWTDKELIVLDTGDRPSPFFTQRRMRVPPREAPNGHCSQDRRSTISPLDDPRVYYIHSQNYPLTLGDKRNQLIQLASGEFVAHFDDDNIYGPQYLSFFVEQLRGSRAQLAQLGFHYSWTPRSNKIFWHTKPADRAEAFVHLHGPLKAIAFDHESCGEEGGFSSVGTEHIVDDTFGIFLHVEHGGNASSIPDGEPYALRNIPNPDMPTLITEHRRFF